MLKAFDYSEVCDLILAFTSYEFDLKNLTDQNLTFFLFYSKVLQQNFVIGSKLVNIEQILDSFPLISYDTLNFPRGPLTQHWLNLHHFFCFSPRLSIEPPLSLPQNGWVRPLFYLIPPVVYGQEKMVFLFTPPDEVVFCDGLHFLLRLHAKKVRASESSQDRLALICLHKWRKRGSVLALLTSCV